MISVTIDGAVQAAQSSERLIGRTYCGVGRRIVK
jgi:hypothetical protein